MKQIYDLDSLSSVSICVTAVPIILASTMLTSDVVNDVENDVKKFFVSLCLKQITNKNE